MTRPDKWLLGSAAAATIAGIWLGAEFGWIGTLMALPIGLTLGGIAAALRLDHQRRQRQWTEDQEYPR